jgi:hypothetical protein
MAAYAARTASHARAIGLNPKATRVVVAFVVLCLIAGLAFLLATGMAAVQTF